MLFWAIILHFAVSFVIKFKLWHITDFSLVTIAHQYCHYCSPRFHQTSCVVPSKSPEFVDWSELNISTDIFNVCINALNLFCVLETIKKKSMYNLQNSPRQHQMFFSTNHKTKKNLLTLFLICQVCKVLFSLMVTKYEQLPKLCRSKLNIRSFYHAIFANNN